MQNESFNVQEWADTAPIGRVPISSKCTVLVYPVGLAHLTKFGNVIGTLVAKVRELTMKRTTEMSDAQFGELVAEFLGESKLILSGELKDLIAECTVPNVLELKPQLPAVMMIPIAKKWFEVSFAGFEGAHLLKEMGDTMASKLGLNADMRSQILSLIRSRFFALTGIADPKSSGSIAAGHSEDGPSVSSSATQPPPEGEKPSNSPSSTS